MVRRIKTHETEQRLQQKCYMWFHNNFPMLRGLLFAVPNGGARSAFEGGILKETGVVPGVSDMLFLYKGRTYCFEMKTLTGTQSVRQERWEKVVVRQGFNYWIIRELKEFQNYINKIINEELK